MPTVREIRAAIGATVTANIDRLKIYKYVPPSVILPCLIIAPASADYLVTHGNAGTGWEFDLHILVQSTEDEVAQDALDDYIDATSDRSIVRVIFENTDLGIDNVSAVVRRMTAHNFRFQAAGDDHIGATLRLSVLATNS